MKECIICGKKKQHLRNIYSTKYGSKRKASNPPMMCIKCHKVSRFKELAERIYWIRSHMDADRRHVRKLRGRTTLSKLKNGDYRL